MPLGTKRRAFSWTIILSFARRSWRWTFYSCLLTLHLPQSQLYSNLLKGALEVFQKEQQGDTVVTKAMNVMGLYLKANLEFVRANYRKSMKVTTRTKSELKTKLQLWFIIISVSTPFHVDSFTKLLASCPADVVEQSLFLNNMACIHHKVSTTFASLEKSNTDV